MFSENKYERFESGIVAVVKGKARDLARKPEFAAHELEDMEQELMLEVITALGNHDAAKAALKTYVRRIVDYTAARMLKNRRAQKRAVNMEMASLDAMFDASEEADSLEETFIDPQPGPDAEVALKMDIETALLRLPKKDRESSHRLRTHTITEVEVLTGTPMASIYDVIYRVRNLFAKERFEDFLK